MLPRVGVRAVPLLRGSVQHVWNIPHRCCSRVVLVKYDDDDLEEISGLRGTRLWPIERRVCKYRSVCNTRGSGAGKAISVYSGVAGNNKNPGARTWKWESKYYTVMAVITLFSVFSSNIWPLAALSWGIPLPEILNWVNWIILGTRAQSAVPLRMGNEGCFLI